MKLKQIYETIIKELDSKQGYDKYIPRIEKALKVKVNSFIGGRTRSDVFDIGGGKVLKITDDDKDVQGFVIGQENSYLPIPKVYKMYELVADDIKNKMWVIISQKAETGNISWEESDALENWFNSNSQYFPTDMDPKNVGRIKGQLVYLDPTFLYDVDISSVKKLKI